MIYINEWLPNPTGTDASAEWIELYNSAGTPVQLDGWSLRNESGKSVSLGGRSVPAKGYLVLRRSSIRLALRNSDGGLFIYSAGGALADHAEFMGAAPEGKSFSRANYAKLDDAHAALQQFVFVDPTPGVSNSVPTSTITVREYPKGAALTRPLETFTVFAIMMGTALCVTGIFLYAVLANEAISNIFFGRNKKNRRDDR